MCEKGGGGLPLREKGGGGATIVRGGRRRGDYCAGKGAVGYRRARKAPGGYCCAEQAEVRAR